MRIIGPSVEKIGIRNNLENRKKDAVIGRKT